MFDFNLKVMHGVCLNRTIVSFKMEKITLKPNHKLMNPEFEGNV